MERSMSWLGAQLVAATMIAVGMLLVHAEEPSGLVMASIGIVLELDLAGAFDRALARAHAVRPRRIDR